MAISKAHIGSELQILNNVMAGVDESIVAYFPFSSSPGDIIKNIMPYGAADYTITTGQGISAQMLQYELKHFSDIHQDKDWSIMIRCYIPANSLSSWTTRRTLFTMGRADTSILSVGTGSAPYDLGCINPTDFVAHVYSNGFYTITSPITVNGFDRWYSFILTYEAATTTATLYVGNEYSNALSSETLTDPLAGLATDTSMLLIGHQYIGTAFTFRDFIVFNKALSADEAVMAHRYDPYSYSEKVVLT